MPDLVANTNSPALFARGHAVYFVDRTGRRWTVFDCLGVRGRLVVVGTASASAEYRVFSGHGGARRCYEFADAESRDVDTQHVERQMAQSRVMVDD